MPSSFLRILAAVIFRHMTAQCVGLLHPAQALLNTSREPQGNFLDMQNMLAFNDTHSCHPVVGGGVLVTNFMKAFEVVNPHYIFAVLKARSAPAWLLAYVHWVFFGRTVIPKIHGKILPGLSVQVGVDMGSAMSPLLFCLTMDVLLRYPDSIPALGDLRGIVEEN